MCGICGKLNFDYSTPVDRDTLQRMNSSLEHRGPDGDGLYLKGPAGIGHRRLSIIDLSTGSQPMCNEDGSVWVTFNGEIYNHKILRQELESKGHRFVSSSDTEVIVHAYEEWGAQSCSRLRGMFAYGIWDENNQRLVLARDRLGQKPLVYSRTETSFVFSSELRSLLQDESVRRKVDLSALNAFLIRLYVPAPQTAFENIYKLPPAHYMVVEKGEINIQRYWDIDFSKKWQADESQYCERLWDLLVDATKMRLMSDVPLGAFLSGGLDSSAIVGIMSRLMNEPVKTFSIRYEESGYDESPHARQIAELFNTQHQEFTVRPNALEVLPKLIFHYGEPFADASSIPTYYVSELTRRYVTVSLSGDGADESFAGYDRYRTARILDLYQKIVPGILRKHVVPASLRFCSKLPVGRNRFHQMWIVSKRGALGADEAYLYRHAYFTPDLTAQLWQKDKLSSVRFDKAVRDVSQSIRKFTGDNSLDCWLYTDLMHYLPDDILVKVDIAGMMNSLEVRSPFLDHKLVEFAATLPPEMKRHGFTTKYILKKTLERLLPKNIIYRPKHGFRIPISKWFQSDLKDSVREVLLDPATIRRGYFRGDRVEKMIKEHESGQIDHGTRLWALLNQELWHRTFIDELRETPVTWEAKGN